MAAEISPRQLLELAFTTGRQAAAPSVCLPPALASLQRRPAVVLGAGKAAASMAAAFHAHWGAPVRGMVVTRYEHGLLPGEQCGGIEVVEAGHPSPDSASLAAGERLLSLAAGVRRDETLICLISGGGSSLASQPLPLITFEQKRAAANFLIRQGADIREINCVRKHLSRLKGGRLAVAAHPAPVATFVISDVPGDDVGAIASGPTVADPTTQQDALAILAKYRYPKLAELMPVLRDPQWETPKPGDPAFAGDSVHLIATAATALAAAARLLRERGYEVLQLGDDLDDEAQALGREHARLAKRDARGGQGARRSCPAARPASCSARAVAAAVVTRSTRRLSRSSSMASPVCTRSRRTPTASTATATTRAASSFRKFWRSAARRGLSLAALLAQHDSYSYFDACGLLVRTGPTRTNVNDFRLILCENQPAPTPR